MKSEIGERSRAGSRITNPPSLGGPLAGRVSRRARCIHDPAHVMQSPCAEREPTLFTASQLRYISRVTAAQYLQPVSVQDYLANEIRSPMKREYTDGHHYARAETNNLHNTIAGAFVGLMFAQLRGRPCQPFNSDTKVRVRMPTHSRFYYPDGMVVCTPNPTSDTFQDRPVILAEVISKATRRIDEGEKRDAYLTIPELSLYLLIESSSPRVVVYHRSDSGFVPRQYEGLEAILRLDAIQSQLPLADLYERVDFSAPSEDDEETHIG
jgi:Uma2 family endonuclease